MCRESFWAKQYCLGALLGSIDFGRSCDFGVGKRSDGTHVIPIPEGRAVETCGTETRLDLTLEGLESAAPRRQISEVACPIWQRRGGRPPGSSFVRPRDVYLAPNVEVAIQCCQSGRRQAQGSRPCRRGYWFRCSVPKPWTEDRR